MQKKRKRDKTPYYLALVALLLAGIAWYRGGISQTLAGLSSGGSILVSVLPLLVAAFLTAGLIQALIPGGPYVYYPIAGALLNTGAGIGVLVAFITAKNLWSVSRIPMELALLGPDLTLIRYGITFLIPPVLGFLAETMFGNTIERIREGVER